MAIQQRNDAHDWLRGRI